MLKSSKFNVEGTFGYAACNDLVEATSDQKSLGICAVLEKTDEVKAIINRENASGGYLEVGMRDDKSPARAMTMEEVVAALSNPDGSSLSGQTVVDAVRTNGPDGDYKIYNVAAMKAANKHTSEVIEGNLDSTHIICQSKKVMTNNAASVRDKTVRDNMPTFQKSDNLAELRRLGIIVKNVSIEDFDVNGVLDWNNLHDYDTLNLLIMSARRVCEAAAQRAITEFANRQKPNQETLLMLLRLQNKNLADSIFKAVYEGEFGEITLSNNITSTDIENISRFSNLLKRYHSQLESVGSGRNISPFTLNIGIKRIRVITTREQTVSSYKKIGKVKRNAVNSFFRMNVEDTGSITAVCTESEQQKLLKDYAPKFISAAMDWLYREQMYFLGLESILPPVNESVIAEISVPKVEQKSTASLLGLSDIEADTKALLVEKFYSLAESVVKNAQDQRAVAAIEAASKIMQDD